MADSTIFFNSASSAGSYTVSGMPTTLTCAGMSIGGPATGTVTFSSFSSVISSSGGIQIGNNVSATTSNTDLIFSFNDPSSTTHGLGAAGFTFKNISMSSVTSTFSKLRLTANLVATSFTLNSGSFDTDTANYSVTLSGSFTILPPGGSTAFVWLNGSTLLIGGTFDVSTVIGTLFFNAGTSTIESTGTSTVQYALKASGQTFYRIRKDATGTGLFGGSFTANEVFLREGFFRFDANTTINVGTLTVVNRLFGNPFLGRASLYTSSAFANVTFNVSTSCTIRGATLEGITYSGPAPSTSGGSNGDAGGNVGLSGVFDTPQNIFWMAASSGQTTLTANWSNTSGGAIDTQLYPLPQHTMVIDDNSPFVPSTINATSSLNTTGRTAGVTTNIATSIYGANYTLSYNTWLRATSDVTFANKYVAQILTTNGGTIGGVASGGPAGSIIVNKYNTTFYAVGEANFSSGALGSFLLVQAGTCSCSAGVQARAVTISSGATLVAPGTIRLSGTVTVWTLEAGGTYTHNGTGMIWVPNGGSSLLNLGNGSYRKIALNQAGNFTLNVASSPYISELARDGDFPYVQPASVTFSGAGIATVSKWSMNGTSTAARIAINGASSAQISTDSYYPIQTTNISLTTLPTPLVNRFYAEGSLDNGGNTNWVFGTAPARSSGFMLFF